MIFSVSFNKFLRNSYDYERACHLVDIFIHSSKDGNVVTVIRSARWNEDSSQVWPSLILRLTWLLLESLLDVVFFKGSSSGEQCSFVWSVWFRPIVRMHAAGQWASSRKRKNDSVGRLLGVWSLLRHVDSWKRWSQKGWPRRMGQDWCARRRKRSSSGCCPCGPRVHPSSRLVRARVKLFLLLFERVWYLVCQGL